MNILIVYDSIYGNTAKIAEAVADRLGRDNHVTTVAVQQAAKLDLSDTDLLIVGSPTRGFQPTPNISEFIAALAPASTDLTAADSTRASTWKRSTRRHCVGLWRLEAMPQRAWPAGYENHGIVLRGDPGAFLVTGTEGPLKTGELERARDWAGDLLTGQPEAPRTESTETANPARKS